MIQKFLLVAVAVCGCVGVAFASEQPSDNQTSLPVSSEALPTKWNIPLINQGNDSSWTVDPNNGNEGGEEDIAQSDLNAERFPEFQNSDPDMVYPGDNSFENFDMGDNFDAPLMESLGEN